MYGQNGGEIHCPLVLDVQPATKKTERLEIRLAPDELALMQECVDRLGTTKTEVVVKGVKLVKAELGKK